MDGRLQAPVDRAAIGEERIHSLHRFTMTLVCMEREPHMNPLNHEHTVFELNLADGL